MLRGFQIEKWQVRVIPRFPIQYQFPGKPVAFVIDPANNTFAVRHPLRDSELRVRHKMREWHQVVG